MIAKYCFGRFELQPATRQLLADGQPVDLGARAFDLLVTLVERPGELLTKDALLERVWPGLVVEENNLQVQISSLRKALGAAAIETIPGRGYCFTAQTTCFEPSAATDRLVHRLELPQQLTRLIGREKDTAQVKALLRSARLLTLIGAGGAGKTRLALKVGADLGAEFADGIALVELASLADARLVPQAVATVLGLKEQQGESLADTLARSVQRKAMLLLLDNCEHLVEPTARLCQVLLARCANVRVLATSREALRVAGELTYRVPSLATPDLKEPFSSQSLTAYPAVQLFIERAQAVKPSFQVDAANAVAVASICHRLDGMPLALELAAARLRSLSVAEVNERLDQRFRLLTGGSRTTLPRHQTLRGLIDWSHDLLGPAEQALLSRLAVFAGGWTLAAAERVCAGDGVDDGEVLDLLASLADKSLVLAEERDGATRYRLLETVRAYAAERLREGGEEARVKERHLSHFAALAEEAEPQIVGSEQQAWLERLEVEHDNLRSALTWANTTAGDGVAGLRLAGAVHRFWWLRGYFGEGRTWISGLLAAVPRGEAPAVRAKAIRGAGGLAWALADFATARALLEEALTTFRELGDRRGTADSLNALGVLTGTQGAYPLARALLEEALKLWRVLDDRRGIALALDNLGTTAYAEGNLAAARALLEEALTLYESGDRVGKASARHGLAKVAFIEGDYSVAQAMHEQCLADFRVTGDRQGMAAAMAGLGNVAAAQGDPALASAHYQESLALRREVGDQPGIAGALDGLAHVALALGRPDRAARICAAAQRLREEIGAPIMPVERLALEHLVAAARQTLGDDAGFDRAWQEGRAMSLDEAVRYGLSDQDAGDNATERPLSATS